MDEGKANLGFLLLYIITTAMLTGYNARNTLCLVKMTTDKIIFN